MIDMDLNAALEQFDTVDANLRRLEKVWKEMRSLIPGGIVLGVSDDRRYENLRRSFHAISRSLPRIDGWRFTGEPLAPDEIAQHQWDANEVHEPAADILAHHEIYGSDVALDEYRFRFDSARRNLVRERVRELVREIDRLLPELVERVACNHDGVSDPDWSTLHDAIAEVERLAGNLTPRSGRWGDMKRHLSFAQGRDLHDIANLDWPSVRADLEMSLYSELEPLPVEVDDLAALVKARPTGRVSTKLAWDRLDDEDFERLLFNVVSSAPGYENPKWLTRTRAPDRGRDISADRVLPDSLSGVARHRVVIQAKHWLTKSIPPDEVSRAIASMPLLEPPPVDVLIIATSGRFTSDAVTWIEKHNNDRKRPTIEPWPESHLELLLAERPHLAREFRLHTQ